MGGPSSFLIERSVTKRDEFLETTNVGEGVDLVVLPLILPSVLGGIRGGPDSEHVSSFDSGSLLALNVVRESSNLKQTLIFPFRWIRSRT